MRNIVFDVMKLLLW